MANDSKNRTGSWAVKLQANPYLIIYIFFVVEFDFAFYANQCRVQWLRIIVGALLFVGPMRKAEYVTMLDPFQERYGAGIGGLLFLPALCGDLFWCGAVLRALGSSLAVVAGVDPNISVCASALLAAMYGHYQGYAYACYRITALQSINKWEIKLESK